MLAVTTKALPAARQALAASAAHAAVAPASVRAHAAGLCSCTFTHLAAAAPATAQAAPRAPATTPFRRNLVTLDQRAAFSAGTLPAHGLAVGATVRKAAPRPGLSRKAALTLTPAAVMRLREITQDPAGPKLLKISTKKKGCSGQVYTLEYVSTVSKFDETVEQDGVKVVIDSKALFSLIGSEMDYVQDKLSAQFVFNNPNVKEMCGCGQSFMT